MIQQLDKNSALRLKQATSDDVKDILSLIHALAEYEKARPEEYPVTEESLLKYGFNDQPYFRCILAYWQGELAGFALYFFQFSTWEGAPTVYLEDLFVKPEFRKHGVGSELMSQVAAAGVAVGAKRMVWQALDWNTLALDFYKSIGAIIMDEWLTLRLQGDALQQCAAKAQFSLQ